MLPNAALLAAPLSAAPQLDPANTLTSPVLLICLIRQLLYSARYTSLVPGRKARPCGLSSCASKAGPLTVPGVAGCPANTETTEATHVVGAAGETTVRVVSQTGEMTEAAHVVGTAGEQP